MAGDWIKVEHSTIDKPEVGYFAELLGVKTDEALGMLLRFWIWLDRNATRNGSVTHVTRLSLDSTMHCNGFSNALVTVGWAEMNDESVTLSVPHFDRLNKNTAKTRNNNAERQARYRERHRNGVTQHVTQQSNGASNEKVTIEEKRREEVTTIRFASQTLSGLAPDDPPMTTETDNDERAQRKAANGRKLADDARAVLSFLNERAGKSFPDTDSNVGIIVARFREGFTPGQLRQVIAMKVREWRGDEKHHKYLRPETLFGRTKFSNYVGELVATPDDEGAAP